MRGEILGFQNLLWASLSGLPVGLVEDMKEQPCGSQGTSHEELVGPWLGGIQERIYHSGESLRGGSLGWTR